MSRRHALVTGASRGIGAAIAAELAASGHAVAVHCGSDTEAARAVAAALPGEGHTEVTGDLGDPYRAAGVLDSAVERLGTVDVLVNNAGIHAEGAVHATTYTEWQSVWRRVVDVNLHGVANLTWCFVDHLKQRPQGPKGARIVNVGSRGVSRGEPDAPAYGAAKAGVHALSQSLAQSLAPLGVAVTAVAPGFVRTDLTAPALEGPGGDAIRAQSPFGRVAEGRDVAAAVAWLASEEAEWAAGTVLDLNGASHLR